MLRDGFAEIVIKIATRNNTNIDDYLDPMLHKAMSIILAAVRSILNVLAILTYGCERKTTFTKIIHVCAIPICQQFADVIYGKSILRCASIFHIPRKRRHLSFLWIYCLQFVWNVFAEQYMLITLNHYTLIVHLPLIHNPPGAFRLRYCNPIPAN